jgi:LacI family transcriptional regulator, galactose operon repressor
VAEHAGVSFKTVSRVINAEPGVSADMVTRVEQAIAALGYRRDDRARRLRQGGTHSGVIGFVLGDVSNPFFSAALRGIEEVASAHELVVVAGSTDGDLERERQVVDAFVSRRVDGLIAVPVPTAGPDSPLRTEVERRTPLVFLDLEPPFPDADLVRSDHRGGARLAVEHLLAHGHRDIAFFGDDPHLFSAIEREHGYRDALDAAGVPVDPQRVVHHHFTVEGWRAALHEYLDPHPRPTALFTAQNFVTAGAVRALHDRRLESTIALVGFDDVEFADVVRPGVSVVPQQPYELGRQAAELLVSRIHGSVAPPARTILTSAVIVRGSGEIPPPASAPTDRGTRSLP